MEHLLQAYMYAENISPVNYLLSSELNEATTSNEVTTSKIRRGD